MTLVQLFDGIVGLRLHDPRRAYGPIVFAVSKPRAAFLDEQIFGNRAFGVALMTSVVPSLNTKRFQAHSSM